MRFNIAYVDKRRAMDIIEKAHGHEMEARAESLFEHVFRGSDMNAIGPEPEGAAQQKAFKEITAALTQRKKDAARLSIRSTKLVSLLTGISEPQKEKVEEEKVVQSPVLAHVLRNIEEELKMSLSEIANNLEKLENAW